MKALLFMMLLISSCADLTTSGAKVGYVESDGDAHEVQDLADKLVAKNNCKFIGYVDAKTALFPGSYSIEENEIHTALRNRAAKIGANVVVANFYRKPAQGIGLLCPEDFANR